MADIYTKALWDNKGHVNAAVYPPNRRVEALAGSPVFCDWVVAYWYPGRQETYCCFPDQDGAMASLKEKWHWPTPEQLKQLDRAAAEQLAEPVKIKAERDELLAAARELKVYDIFDENDDELLAALEVVWKIVDRIDALEVQS